MTSNNAKTLSAQEALLRKTVPVVINSFNQYYYLEKLLSQLISNNFKNLIIIDNKSTYPPLCRFLEEVESRKIAKVLTYEKNLGPRAFHLQNYHKILSGIPHFYTDPDLDLGDLSDEFVTNFMLYSEKYRAVKVACGITIPKPEECKPGNFPPHNISIIENELRFWTTEIEPGLFLAHVDTTFHLFNPLYLSSNWNFLDGIRICKEGFMVRHRPYYIASDLPDEELLYYKATTKWSNFI
jgi:hypothetical protein